MNKNYTRLHYEPTANQHFGNNLLTVYVIQFTYCTTLIEQLSLLM